MKLYRLFDTTMNYHVKWISLHEYKHKYYKGQYHESVSKLRYADVSLTTVHWERCFALSERICTSPLVTLQNSREYRAVTTFQFSAVAL